MPLVVRAFVDPTPERIDFFLNERRPVIDGRHALTVVVTGHAPHQQTVPRVARHNGRAVALIEYRRAAFVEPEIPLPVCLVRAVTLPAVFGKDGPHVAIEPHLVGRGRARRGDQGQQQETPQHHVHILGGSAAKARSIVLPSREDLQSSPLLAGNRVSSIIGWRSRLGGRAAR